MELEKSLNEYLEKIEKYLKPLIVSERVDIVKEIKSEMLELQARGRFYNEIGQSGRHPCGCSVRTDFVQRYMRRKRGSI